MNSLCFLLVSEAFTLIICLLYSIYKLIIYFPLFSHYLPLPPCCPFPSLPIPVKYKQRKTHGQLTKSLHSADTPTKARRRPFNSGELRTKAGDDYDQYGDRSMASQEKMQRNLRKLPRPAELPLNDRGHEASALRQNEANADIDGDEDDDDNDNDNDYEDEEAEAGSAGKQELSTWNKNKNKSQLQLPPTSNFASTDAAASEDKPGTGADVVKPLSSGLLARLPSTPRNLLAQIVKPRFVTLSWQEPLQNANEVVSYTVYYRVNNSER